MRGERKRTISKKSKKQDEANPKASEGGKVKVDLLPHPLHLDRSQAHTPREFKIHDALFLKLAPLS